LPFLSSHPLTSGVFLYNNNPVYPLYDGYYFIRPRVVNINGFRIQTYSLKDRQGIYSIKLPADYTIRDFNNNVVPAFSFANEDYIFILHSESTSLAEFEAAMNFLNTYNVVNVSFTTGQTSKFSVFNLVPDWNNESYELNDTKFIELREYFNYYVDFSDYTHELFKRMREELQIPVKHQSELMYLKEQGAYAFITYVVEYQDKPLHALYRWIKPFDTHQFVSAKINFSFHTNDILIMRGFIIDYNQLRKLTGTITEVGVFKSPSQDGYWAAVKWSLDEPNYEIENVIENISSDRGYYHFQYNFSAELMYFLVRPEKQKTVIEEILAYFVEPKEITCETIDRIVNRLQFIQQGNNMVPSSNNNVPYKLMHITSNS